ncbi:MAG: hypothetical protein AAF125_17950 [Chloroflexota bacterium]
MVAIVMDSEIYLSSGGGGRFSRRPPPIAGMIADGGPERWQQGHGRRQTIPGWWLTVALGVVVAR